MMIIFLKAPPTRLKKTPYGDRCFSIAEHQYLNQPSSHIQLSIAVFIWYSKTYYFKDVFGIKLLFP